MFRTAMLLAVVCLTSGVTAQITMGPPYVASSEAAAGYADLTNPTVLSLGDDDLSPVIHISQFSLYYYGSFYNDFRVGSNGYILMGTLGTTTSTAPLHATEGLAIAPFWADLDPAAGGQVAYQVQPGKLVVEWKNVPVRVQGSTSTHAVRMQLSINSVTRLIQFSYAAPNATGATSTAAGTVAISDAPGAGQHQTIYGADPGYVGANGVVTAYPAGRLLNFAYSNGTSTMNPIRITSSPNLPDGDVGTAYSATITAGGGAMPYSWQVGPSAPLPSGWTLASAGASSATVSAAAGNVTPGNYTFWINVYSAVGTGEDGQYFHVRINAAPISITTPSPLPAGTEGSNYAHTFAATGGHGALTWSATNLPAGWSMDPSGMLNAPGGSVLPGTFNFDVTVEDALVPPTTASAPFGVDIVALGAPLIITSPGTLTYFVSGPTSQSFQFTAAGGYPPYTWSTAGLPPGWGMSTDGELSVVDPSQLTPTGPFTFTAIVEDQQQGTTSGPFKMTFAGLTAKGGKTAGSASGCQTGSAGVGWLVWALLVTLVTRRATRERVV